MVLNDFCLKSLIRPVIDFPWLGRDFSRHHPAVPVPRAMRVIADSFIERYVEADLTHIAPWMHAGF